MQPSSTAAKVGGWKETLEEVKLDSPRLRLPHPLPNLTEGFRSNQTFLSPIDSKLLTELSVALSLLPSPGAGTILESVVSVWPGVDVPIDGVLQCRPLLNSVFRIWQAEVKYAAGINPPQACAASFIPAARAMRKLIATAHNSNGLTTPGMSPPFMASDAWDVAAAAVLASATINLDSVVEWYRVLQPDVRVPMNADAASEATRAAEAWVAQVSYLPQALRKRIAAFVKRKQCVPGLPHPLSALQELRKGNQESAVFIEEVVAQDDPQVSVSKALYEQRSNFSVVAVDSPLSKSVEEGQFRRPHQPPRGVTHWSVPRPVSAEEVAFGILSTSLPRIAESPVIVAPLFELLQDASRAIMGSAARLNELEQVHALADRMRIVVREWREVCERLNQQLPSMLVERQPSIPLALEGGPTPLPPCTTYEAVTQAHMSTALICRLLVSTLLDLKEAASPTLNLTLCPAEADDQCFVGLEIASVLERIVMFGVMECCSSGTEWQALVLWMQRDSPETTGAAREALLSTLNVHKLGLFQSLATTQSSLTQAERRAAVECIESVISLLPQFRDEELYDRIQGIFRLLATLVPVDWWHAPEPEELPSMRKAISSLLVQLVAHPIRGVQRTVVTAIAETLASGSLEVERKKARDMLMYIVPVQQVWDALVVSVFSVNSYVVSRVPFGVGHPTLSRSLYTGGDRLDSRSITNRNGQGCGYPGQAQSIHSPKQRVTACHDHWNVEWQHAAAIAHHSTLRQ